MKAAIHECLGRHRLSQPCYPRTSAKLFIMPQKTFLWNLPIFAKLIFSMYFLVSNNSMALIPAKCSVFFPVVSSFKLKVDSSLLKRPGIWRASIKLACDLPPGAQMLQLLEDGNFTILLWAPELALKALFWILSLTFCNSALYLRVAQPWSVYFPVNKILDHSV